MAKLQKRNVKRVPLLSGGAPKDAVEQIVEPSTPVHLNEFKFSSDSSVDAFGKLYVPNGQADLQWQPTTASAFKILFSFRIAAAMWCSISDCDEVYNYWEPLHMFLYGNGFQTWEYSPIYAIRSYAYILLHAVPGTIMQFALPSNKIGVFITERCILGIVSVLAELSLYRALCTHFGNGIARLYLVFTVLSPGMFISSCAFLPSSFSMSANVFAIAAYISNHWFMAIFFTAVSGLVSWPFAVILGLPIVLDMFFVRFRELFASFITYSLMSGTAIIAALIFIDSYFFGRIVLAPMNIILYNVFTSHGPDLYGVENVTFYLKNLLLNWNIAVLLCPFAVPFAAVAYVSSRSSPQLMHNLPYFSLAFWRRYLPILFISMSVALWCAIFFWQPHKEERFLFPIYPMIAVLSAVALDALPCVGGFITGAGTKRFWQLLALICLFMFSALSVSRIIAIHRNFSAPIEVFKGLNEHFRNPAEVNASYWTRRENDSKIHVCIGKEWYRFPSSFFLPSNVLDHRGRSWTTELNFIKSEFSGLLPKPFLSGPLPQITRAIPTAMNDMNREEIGRYVDLDVCDYLIDLETPNTTELEPNYAEQHHIWRSIIKKRFLLSSYSHPLYRAFYLPVLSESKIVFGNYHLLQRISR